MVNFRKRPLLSNSSCGLFDRLPKELQFHIFSFLPLADVGNFSLASEGCRLLVSEWVPTKCCLTRAIFPMPNEDVPVNENGPLTAFLGLLKGPNKMNDFAILIKRMTCLLNTRDRIIYAFGIFEQYMNGKMIHPHQEPDPEIEMTRKTKRMRLSSVSSEKSEGASQDWEYTCNVIKFFTILHTFIKGWDESEFPLLLDEVTKKFEVKTKISSLLQCCQKGQELALATEMELRLLTRCLTWDVAGNDYGHRASWLLAIMKYYVGCCARQQAMVFLLMFGPSCEDAQDHYDRPELLTLNQRMVLKELNNHTDWDRFVDNVAEDFYEGKEMFYTLAQALCSCISACSKWKKDSASTVLDEMFEIPQKWKRENVAGFLLFCSEGLILHYIQYKLNAGKEEQVKQAAQLLVDMIIISHKYDNAIEADKGIGKVFDIIAKTPKGEVQSKFFVSIWEIITTEVQERELALDEGEHIEVLKKFAIHLMNQAYREVMPEQLDVKKYEDDEDTENDIMEAEE